MTTYAWSSLFNNGTDAEFRTWGSGMATALAALGLKQTSDTGQINWSSVVRAAVNNYAGYEVWRFNDTVQATSPLFVKVEYGTGASGLYPALRFTVGKGSDGTGSVTGVLLPATTWIPPANAPNASIWYSSSADGSMLGLVPAVGTYVYPNYQFSLVLERSRGVDGSATGVGFTFFSQSGAAASGKGVNYATSTTLTMNRYPAAVWGYNASTLGAGGNTVLFPAMVTDGAGNWWQPRGVLTGLTADLGSFSVINVPGWGTYLPAGQGFSGWEGGASSGVCCGALAWW